MASIEKHESGDGYPARDPKGIPSVQQNISTEEVNGPAAPKPLARDLKGRHMQMIALGGAIGSGYFISIGSALQGGGPASVLIGFLIVGVMMLCTTQAIAELAVQYPINGTLFSWACRFLDPSWGFAMGWLYAISWLTTLPFELTAAGLAIDFWNSSINNGVWCTVFLVAVVIIQFFGVKGYGEVEFVLGIVKVIGIIGFTILGIIINCGGVPTDHRGYIGFEYWNNPGAFQNGFPGFCSVFVTAAFTFGGTELIALTAAEAADPHKEIPRATKQVFWRIALFYLVSLLILGIIVPANAPELLNASSSDTKDSPFVLAIRLAGIPVLPSIFNAIITVAVLSVANSSVYGATRTMQALALEGMAPKILQYVDSKGRPVACIVVQLLFGLLAYITEASSSETIFNWLLALSGLSAFFNWGSICAAHIRYRDGWRVQGHQKSEIPYQAAFGVWGSWVGLGLCVLCTVATFYTALWPNGELGSAYNFFLQFVAAPIVLVLWLAWKLWSRNWSWYVRSADMDITPTRLADSRGVNSA